MKLTPPYHDPATTYRHYVHPFYDPAAAFSGAVWPYELKPGLRELVRMIELVFDDWAEKTYAREGGGVDCTPTTASVTTASRRGGPPSEHAAGATSPEG